MKKKKLARGRDLRTRLLWTLKQRFNWIWFGVNTKTYQLLWNIHKVDVAPVERVLNFQETDQSLWTSPNQEDTPISYPLSHSRGKRWKVVAGTFNSLHSASSPSGFISLNRTVVFVMVQSSFLLHVTLTLQPCISDSLLFIKGVIGLPLNNENNTAIT